MIIVIISVISLVGGGIYCIYHWRRRRVIYHIVAHDACEEDITNDILPANDILHDTATTTVITTNNEQENNSDKTTSLKKWTLR